MQDSCARKRSAERPPYAAARGRGVSLRRQGLRQEAVTGYKRAIKIAPGYPAFYYNVGMAFAGARILSRPRQTSQRPWIWSRKWSGAARPLPAISGCFFAVGRPPQGVRFFPVGPSLKPGMKPALPCSQGSQGAQRQFRLATMSVACNGSRTFSIRFACRQPIIFLPRHIANHNIMSYF